MECGLLVGRVVADYNPGQDVLAEWPVPHPRVYSRVASTAPYSVLYRR